MITILKFQANWCNPCKILSPILKEVADETHCIVEEIDIDENEEKCEVFGIRSIPTLVFIKDSIVMHKAIGSKTKQQLLSIINSIR